MHNLLGILYPTNNPKLSFSFLLSHLNNIKEVSDYSTFLINFQEPWTNEEIDKAVNLIKSYGFNVEFSFNKYDNRNGLVFNKIRNDCLRINNKVKFCLLVDDDMTPLSNYRYSKYSYGHQLLHCLKYMINYDKCGMITLDQRKRNHKANTIYPVINETCWNGRGGNLIRVINNKIMDDKCDLLVGWGEELLVCSYIFSNGYYHAKLSGTSCNHLENFNVTINGVTNTKSTKFKKDIKIAESNAYKYIKEYNPDFKGYCDYHLMNKENYLLNNGIDYNNLLNNDNYIYEITDIVPDLSNL